jgi:8-oxo-dGTP diphosphatase
MGRSGPCMSRPSIVAVATMMSDLFLRHPDGGADALHTDRRHARLFPVAGTQARVDDPSQRADDPHLGHYNGIGGKAEPDEECWPACVARLARKPAPSASSCPARRGQLAVSASTARTGLVSFSSSRDSMAHPSGRIPKMRANLVRSARYRYEGDHHFPAAGIDACLRPFHGVMPYRDGRMQSWMCSRV